ncbi:MAG: flagellar assembly peptidoglycan hydrolase FlgJ [Candidatus Thiodiazotropha sp.]
MNTLPSSVYNNFSGLAALRHEARDDQAGASEKVARQFESLFIQMMVKQMRQTSFGDGLLDSKQTKFVRDMYDQQLALHLSEQRGMGLSEMLQHHIGGAQASESAPLSGLQPYWSNPARMAGAAMSRVDAVSTEQTATDDSVSGTTPIESPDEFVSRLWQAAESAATELGLDPQALLAQAALETGWGARVMPNAQGGVSHNLFGIKADQRWTGEQVRKETLEYTQDVAVRRREPFRCYPSYEESFQDYVAFLRQNPRYEQALKNTQDSEAYFQALQDAGYATDPNYAEKILKVMQGPEMQAAVDRFKGSSQQPI